MDRMEIEFNKFAKEALDALDIFENPEEWQACNKWAKIPNREITYSFSLPINSLTGEISSFELGLTVSLYALHFLALEHKDMAEAYFSTRAFIKEFDTNQSVFEIFSLLCLYKQLILTDHNHYSFELDSGSWMKAIEATFDHMLENSSLQLDSIDLVEYFENTAYLKPSKETENAVETEFLTVFAGQIPVLSTGFGHNRKAFETAKKLAESGIFKKIVHEYLNEKFETLIVKPAFFTIKKGQSFFCVKSKDDKLQCIDLLGNNIVLTSMCLNYSLVKIFDKDCAYFGTRELLYTLDKILRNAGKKE